MSNRLIASLLLALAAFSTCVSATYFTAPAASTVWTTAAGQDITWKYQPGGAPNGDIILIGMSPTGSPMCVECRPFFPFWPFLSCRGWV